MASQPRWSYYAGMTRKTRVWLVGGFASLSITLLLLSVTFDSTDAIRIAASGAVVISAIVALVAFVRNPSREEPAALRAVGFAPAGKTFDLALLSYQERRYPPKERRITTRRGYSGP